MPKGLKFKDLEAAIEWSLTQLEGPRNQRVHSIKQYVGSHYAAGGADKRVPVNMLELAITIYVRALAARAPQVMVTTAVDELRPFAKNMQLALNQIPEEIGLASTMRRAVIEAMFGIGVCKVALTPTGSLLLDHDPGEPFVDLVTLDDYFLDMSAKSRKGIQFEGNDYWIDVESARAMQDGTSKALEPDDHSVSGHKGESRAEGIGVSEGAIVARDKVWLRDVWLPGTQELVTYAVTSKKIVRERIWDGPEPGPYHVLSFNDVPGNILPLAPVSLLIDLHELGNLLFRKLSKQAEAKKTVAAFAGGNDPDVEALKKARDGEGIKYTGQKPEALTVGGIDAPTLAFYLQVKDQFNYHAGNLDTLGGLSPVADTVGQEKLVTQGASARMESMASRTTDFARKIFKALAWYEWTDPVRKRMIEKPVEGSDIVLRREWSEETREGDFLDYNLDIDPYSMTDDNPALRLQKIGTALERFVFPMLPVIQQQGGSLNFQRLIELVARLANVDELKDLVVFSEPTPGDPPQGSQSPVMKPPNTTRTYERVNRPGATRAGKDDVMGRLLMGGGVQGSEAAAIGRPAS